MYNFYITKKKAPTFIDTLSYMSNGGFGYFKNSIKGLHLHHHQIKKLIPPQNKNELNSRIY